MQYAQLNEDGTYSHQLPATGNVLWDENNFCSAEALIRDGKAEQFRVVELHETEPPEIDPLTQRVTRDGGEFVGGIWQYKWRVENKTPEELEAELNAWREQAAIPPLQGLLAIDQMGLAEGFQSWASSPDRTFAERAFLDKAQTWRRNDPVLIAGATALEVTPEQLDQIFMEILSSQ